MPVGHRDLAIWHFATSAFVAASIQDLLDEILEAIESTQQPLCDLDTVF